MGKDPEVKEAAVKIQSVYRGFQTRKVTKKKSAMEVAMAVIRIQRAYRRYKERKYKENIRKKVSMTSSNQKQSTVIQRGAKYNISRPRRGRGSLGNFKADERNLRNR